MLFRFGKRGALDFPRAYLTAKYLQIRGEETVPLYWFSAIKNWGDQVGPYLVARITGAQPVPAYSVSSPHILAVGSILARSSSASLIWGAGFISESETLERLPKAISAVRGLHSSRRLEELGIEAPSVVGDPALLMPRFYKPVRREKNARIGLIPHYADLQLLREMRLPENVRIIDIRQDVEAFIDDLCSCEVVLSSSLHGLIAADAYAIPNLWVEFSDRVIGNGFKFNDYYSSLDEPDTSPHIIKPNRTVDFFELASRSSLHKQFMGSQDLLDAFPWRQPT